MQWLNRPLDYVLELKMRFPPKGVVEPDVSWRKRALELGAAVEDLKRKADEDAAGVS